MAAPLAAAAIPVAQTLALKVAEGAAVAAGTYVASKAAPIAAKHAKALKEDIDAERADFRRTGSLREKAQALRLAAQRVHEKHKKRTAQSRHELAQGAADAALTGAVGGAVSRSNPGGVDAEIRQMLRTAPPDWRAQYAKARGQLIGLGLPDPGPTLSINGALAVLQLTAGGRYSKEDPGAPGVTPPADVRREALHGLRLSHKNNYGAWAFIGIARAILLALGRPLSAEGQKRMKNYFTRHRKDKQAAGFGSDIAPSKGYMAWLNWGGEAGKEWLEEIMARNNPRVFIPGDRPLASRKTDLDRRRPLDAFVSMLIADLAHMDSPTDFELDALEDGDGAILNITLRRTRRGEKMPAFSLHVPVRNEAAIPYLSRFLRNVQLKKPTHQSLSLLPLGTELRAQVMPMRRNPYVGSQNDFRMHMIDRTKQLAQSGAVLGYEVSEDPAAKRFDIIAVLKDGTRVPTQKYALTYEKAAELAQKFHTRGSYAGGYTSEEVNIPGGAAAYGTGAASARPFMQRGSKGTYVLTSVRASELEKQHAAGTLDKTLKANIRSVDDLGAFMAEQQRLLDQGFDVLVMEPASIAGWKLATR